MGKISRDDLTLACCTLEGKFTGNPDISWGKPWEKAWEKAWGNHERFCDMIISNKWDLMMYHILMKSII